MYESRVTYTEYGLTMTNIKIYSLASQLLTTVGKGSLIIWAAIILRVMERNSGKRNKFHLTEEVWTSEYYHQ